MRKEIPTKTEVVPKQETKSVITGPKGYVNRGDECQGGFISGVRPLHGVPMKACAVLCNKVTGCSGFNYGRQTQSCYFKGSTCEAVISNVGMQFFQRETCDYRREACMKAATATSLMLAEPFVVDGNFSGCFIHTTGDKAGRVFYGTIGGRDARVKDELTFYPPRSLQLLQGFYHCMLDAEPTVLLQQEEELVLEDEMDRVSKLSPEQLRREAVVELLAPGTKQFIEHERRFRAPFMPASVVDIGEGSEDQDGMIVNIKEDAEDKRFFPEHQIVAAKAKLQMRLS